MPPVSEALSLYLAPKRLPINTPNAEITKVVHPISPEALPILTERNAKVIPIASASILVATAISSSSFRSNRSLANSSSSLPSSCRVSHTIFPPMNSSSTKAIQWSYRVMYCANRLPSSQPKKGISAWNPPKNNAMIKVCR